MPLNIPPSSNKSTFEYRTGEGFCAILIPEDNSDSSQNVENENLPEAINETQPPDSSGLENSIDGNLHETFCDADFEYKVYFNDHKDESKTDVLKFLHNECRVVITPFLSWPKSYKSLRFYQFCKLNHSIVHQLNQNKILLGWLFYNFDLDYNSNSDFKEYVPDSPYYIFYDEIDENTYNKNGCFRFRDRPGGSWSYTHELNGEKYSLTEINKYHDFFLFFVGVTEKGEEIPIKCWKWGYTFNYDPVEGGRHTPRKPVEVDVQFPFGICKLPHANNRQFLFQFPDRLKGIPPKVIEYPKELPEGYTKKHFEKEMIRILCSEIATLDLFGNA